MFLAQQLSNNYIVINTPHTPFFNLYCRSIFNRQADRHPPPNIKTKLSIKNFSKISFWEKFFQKIIPIYIFNHKCKEILYSHKIHA